MAKRSNGQKKKNLAKRAFLMGVEWALGETCSDAECGIDPRVNCEGLHEKAKASFDSENMYDALMRVALRDAARANDDRIPDEPDSTPDWSGKCEVCGASPIVPVTGMCGPCSFGEADTAGGNW